MIYISLLFNLFILKQLFILQDKQSYKVNIVISIHYLHVIHIYEYRNMINNLIIIDIQLLKYYLFRNMVPSWFLPALSREDAEYKLSLQTPGVSLVLISLSNHNEDIRGKYCGLI